LSTLVDELLTILNLRLDTSQFFEVFPVDVLEVLDLLDLHVLLFADNSLAFFVVRCTCIPTSSVTNIPKLNAWSRHIDIVVFLSSSAELYGLYIMTSRRARLVLGTSGVIL